MLGGLNIGTMTLFEMENYAEDLREQIRDLQGELKSVNESIRSQRNDAD